MNNNSRTVVMVIIMISIIYYSNLSPPVSHTTGCSHWSLHFQQNTSEFWYAGLPSFEQGSDRIAYAPDIIIVEIVDIVYWVQFSTGIRRTWKHVNMRTMVAM